MKIAIVIPVYNRQALVKDALDSVLAQSYSDWECIVVDDGSTDETWKVLEEYAQKDKRIKIHKRNREPKGAPTCRNIGAKQSKGDLLMFWDSDDIMAPWCVEERVDFMKKNPALDFGLFQLLRVYLDNSYALRCYVGQDDYLKRFLSFENAWGTPAVIWRKAFYNKVGGWTEAVAAWQDGELHIRALLFNPNYGWGSKIPTGITRMGVDSNSITYQKKTIAIYKNLIDAFSMIMPLLDSYYSNIFKNGINAWLWHRTFSFSLADKKTVINYAVTKNLVSKRQKNKFCYNYTIYNYIKHIPYLRGLFYRLFIHPKFNRPLRKETEEIETSIKSHLLKKVEGLSPNNKYRQLFEDLLIET